MLYVNLMNQENLFKALGHEKRLKLLEWLKRPHDHFPPQRDGDLELDGVCVILIAEKMGVSQPTATQHIRILLDSGLVKSKRIGKWTFISRDERTFARLGELVAEL